MLQIRPVSDLRNKFPNIEKIVNAGEPVYLTQNEYKAIFGGLRKKINVQ